ncbi:hypothetical protein HHI36_008165, partial [Cryptolaemus montrouzieri]
MLRKYLMTLSKIDLATEITTESAFVVANEKDDNIVGGYSNRLRIVMKNISPCGNFLSHHAPKRAQWKATNAIVGVICLLGILPGFFLTASAETDDKYPAFYRFLAPENSTLYSINCSWPCLISENSTFVNDTNKTSLDVHVEEPLADIILLGVLSVVLGLMILVTVI